MRSSYVTMPGKVRTFDYVHSDKAQAAKVLEEAAEVFGAWQEYSKAALSDLPFPKRVSSFVDEERKGTAREDLASEIADVIQACCNLAKACGIDNLDDALADCEEKNAERGRITTKPDDYIPDDEILGDPDPVTDPEHYRGATCTCDYALASMVNADKGSEPPMAAFWRSMAFRYLWRYNRKNGVEDLRKCRESIDRMIEVVEAQ